MSRSPLIVHRISPHPPPRAPTENRTCTLPSQGCGSNAHGSHRPFPGQALKDAEKLAGRSSVTTCREMSPCSGGQVQQCKRGVWTAGCEEATPSIGVPLGSPCVCEMAHGYDRRKLTQVNEKILQGHRLVRALFVLESFIFSHLTSGKCGKTRRFGTLETLALASAT